MILGVLGWPDSCDIHWSQGDLGVWNLSGRLADGYLWILSHTFTPTTKGFAMLLYYKLATHVPALDCVDDPAEARRVIVEKLNSIEHDTTDPGDTLS